MTKIVIQNLYNKGILVVNKDKNLLEAIHRNGIDWMYACGAKGRCTTCKVVVIKGINHFTPESSAELKLRVSNRLKANERLVCQCNISADVIVKVATENKLNHINYSE